MTTLRVRVADRGAVVVLTALVVALLLTGCGGTDREGAAHGGSEAGRSSVDDAAEPCKLPIADGRGDVAIGGWPRATERLRATGEVVATVIMVDFPDAPAIVSPEDAFAKIAPSDGIFDDVSYGRLDYRLEPVMTWYRMSQPSTAYAPLTSSFDRHREYIAEAVALADADVDFSSTESLIVLANPDAKGLGEAGPAFTPISADEGIAVDGTVLMNGATSAHDLNHWGAIWLNHEVTHTLGLPDLYAFDGPEAFPYTGEFGYMGLSNLDANSPGLFAWERWVLGWIDDDQVSCLASPPSVPVSTVLSPLGTAGGSKAVMVALGPTSVVVAEARTATGLDAGIRKEGVLVYTVDSSVESGFGPVRVFPADPADPAVGFTTFFEAPRAVGESVEVEGVRVTVVSRDGDGFRIELSAA
jgi:M6 family metalloprotease-like protein